MFVYSFVIKTPYEQLDGERVSRDGSVRGYQETGKLILHFNAYYSDPIFSLCLFLIKCWIFWDIFSRLNNSSLNQQKLPGW